MGRSGYLSNPQVEERGQTIRFRQGFYGFQFAISMTIHVVPHVLIRLDQRHPNFARRVGDHKDVLLRRCPIN